jgi:hypothetical protein
MTNKWTLDVLEDELTGDSIIQFPDDFLAVTGWQEGDVIEWIDNKDGTWTIRKKEVT